MLVVDNDEHADRRAVATNAAPLPYLEHQIMPLLRVRPFLEWTLDRTDPQEASRAL
jgi:hypothetical protein